VDAVFSSIAWESVDKEESDRDKLMAIIVLAKGGVVMFSPISGRMFPVALG